MIPKFVMRHVNGSPAPVLMRCADAPNKPIQDLKKYELLCRGCESLFQKWETPAAERIFQPFRYKCRAEFQYGEWLHKFMASLSWRTLAVKLRKYQEDETNSRQVIAELKAAFHMTHRYLQGADCLADQIKQHFIIWDDPGFVLSDLTRFDVNTLVRQTFVHEVLIEKSHGWSAVIHNHGGCIYVMIVRGNPTDNWRQTKVKPAGGFIKQPQSFPGWIIATFIRALVATHGEMKGRLSLKQRTKIAEDVRADATGTRRFIVRDQRANIID